MPLEQQLVDFIAQSTALINEVTGKKGLLDEKVATATDQAAIAIAQAALAADQVTAAAAQVDAAADQVAAAAAQVDLALAQQNLAAAKAAESAASAVLSTEQAAIATQKAADAVAVVTGGTASLAPAAGKSPITGAGTTINPAWLDQLPSRAAFEKTANSRRQMFAGSGFVEWGKHDSGQPAINQGMFTYAAANSGVANMLFLGRSNTNLAGTSKTTFPVVAANGYLLRVDRVAEAGNPSAQIRLPPAPATADLLDREDLVFLEVWHEDVAEKDFIYPFGSVQFLAGAYVPPGGTSINTVVPTIANFGGIDTYSLFGNWQAAGALVGRGMKFSTMTAVQRQQFLSDPENNCYLDGDRIIQVRYRIRVVQGLGSAWKNVNPQNPSEYLNYSGGSTFVAAKGKLVVLASDYRVGNDNVFLPVNDAAAKAKSPGAFSILATSSVGAAYNNLCFAVPVALVHRRNQGAYHPIWNPNGTNSFRNSEGTTQQPWYSSTARVPTSTADCFNFWNGSDGIATWQPNGGIAGNSSGRPDGLFFDEINERDVRDLRNSAIKQADLRRTLEREFNKLVAGMTRGWEKPLRVKTLAAVAQGVNGGYYRDVGTSVIQIYRTTQAEADAVSLGSDVRIINTSTGQSVSFKVASRNYAGGVYRLIGGSVVGALDNKNVTDAWAGSITMSEQVVRQSKTLLHCDIIGDPANYPQAWKDNGVAGTPLLVAEDGVTSLIPDGTSKPYKLSRKLRGAGVLMALLSTDGGITWVDTTSTVNGLFSTTTNSWTALYSTGRILLAFYLTEASPLELATNAEVLSLGDVWAGNAFNRPLIGYFVGKISTLSTLPSYSTADSVHVNRRPVFGASDGKIYGTGNYGNDPAHPTLNIQASATPAAKALPYITRANGKLYLQALYKEMRHNGTSWGDDAKFSVVDNESTTTDLNAATIKIGQKRLELPFFIADGE